MKMMNFTVVCLTIIVLSGAANVFADEGNWYRGCIHAHSFWSDGNTFPELAAEDYRGRGYDFLSLTDHNILAQRERWKDVKSKRRPIPDELMKKYLDRFGKDWVETRGSGDKLQVRLKTLDETRKVVETADRFILIQGEEITGKFEKLQVHVGALNVAEVIQPQKGRSVVDTIQRDMAMLFEQSVRLKRPMVGIINHPSWPTFDITASDLAAAKYARLVEFGNAGGGCLFNGDADHPGMERIWDIANTIRISNMEFAPLFGVASDDAHDYRVTKPDRSDPGKAWIMVRAAELKPTAIVEAIARGDFYSSSGVTLRDMKYDADAGTLSVNVQPEAGVKYVIDFIGTMANYDRSSKMVEVQGGRPHRVRRYSKDIGKVLMRVKGPKGVYRLSGNELFVRATVHSDKPMAKPVRDGMKREQAWTQPIGWGNRVK
jgi:hypothetical protein